MQQFDLAHPVKADLFTPLRGYGTNEIHTWIKPSWATSIYIVAVSGGAGGGGGCSGPANTQRGAGAGGAGGAITRAFLPSCFCPRTLFIKIGRGGSGGAADTPGESGGASRVGLWVNASGVIDAPGLLINTSIPQGGSQGTATTGGPAAASAGPVTPYYKCFYFQTDGKSSGRGGDTGTGGTGTQQPLGPGAGYGGAGCAATFLAAGGSGTTGLLPSLYGTNGSGGTGSSTGNGGSGDNGATVWLPGEYSFSAQGGGGGGNSNTGTGGNGGNGGLASGGGGAGGGFTGGRGGDGGDGMVIIYCW